MPLTFQTWNTAGNGLRRDSPNARSGTVILVVLRIVSRPFPRSAHRERAQAWLEAQRICREAHGSISERRREHTCSKAEDEPPTLRLRDDPRLVRHHQPRPPSAGPAAVWAQHPLHPAAVRPSVSRPSSSPGPTPAAPSTTSRSLHLFAHRCREPDLVTNVRNVARSVRNVAESVRNVEQSPHRIGNARSPGLLTRGSFCARYWDRTSDLFRVREARYRCANRALFICCTGTRGSLCAILGSNQ